jgi:hypothetical protein
MKGSTRRLWGSNESSSDIMFQHVRLCISPLQFYSRFIGEGLVYAMTPCSNSSYWPSIPLSDSAGQCPSTKNTPRRISGSKICSWGLLPMHLFPTGFSD